MTLRLPKRLSTMTPSHHRSKVQEKAAAKRMSAKQTKGSGSSYEKGDVRLKGLLRLEAKTTKNRSFSVTTEMLDKVEQACMGADEVPVIEVELDNASGHPRRVYVVPAWCVDDLFSIKPKA